MTKKKKTKETIDPTVCLPCGGTGVFADPDDGEIGCLDCGGTGKREVPAEPPAPRTAEQSRMALQRKVRMFYDLQRLRIQAAGRTLEQAPGVEIHLHPEDVAILEARAGELHRQEKAALRDVQDHLNLLPVYMAMFPKKNDEVRRRWKGCGVTLAGVLFSAIDIHRARTVSALWKFSGLDVVPAIRCSKCYGVVEIGKPHPKRRCDLAGAVVVEADTYGSGKKPHRTKGEKSPYNGWLRAKMIGVLGPSLLKSASPYRKFYDDFKHRKQHQQMPDGRIGWGESDLHRHNAAIRYMVKMFLADFWEHWRRFEGLEVRPRYQEQYLGHAHHGDVMDGAAA